MIEQQRSESVTMEERWGGEKWRVHGLWSIELECDSDVVHRSKSQIILFYAHMNKANGARKICELLSNWPVRILKPCQATVRERASQSERTPNYWISFSCHSLHISLSNLSSHHDHGSVLYP